LKRFFFSKKKTQPQDALEASGRGLEQELEEAKTKLKQLEEAERETAARATQLATELEAVKAEVERGKEEVERSRNELERSKEDREKLQLELEGRVEAAEREPKEVAKEEAKEAAKEAAKKEADEVRIEFEMQLESAKQMAENSEVAREELELQMSRLKVELEGMILRAECFFFVVWGFPHFVSNQTTYI
jgi:colicin import membrane protein